MNGERRNPSDSVDFIVPTVSSGSKGFAVGSIADYFGIPTGVPNLEVSALPFRMYNMIYNEWFRDENLQDSLPDNYGDGPDNIADYNLVRRGKRHDYFTSCAVSPQKGPGVEIPLGGEAPVTLFPVGSSNAYLPVGSKSWTFDNTASGYPSSPYMASTSGRSLSNFTLSKFAQLDGAFADLSEATAITINSLRTALSLQSLYEADFLGGTRYAELLLSHFGVVSPDARLQRPEYLGGSSSLVNINPVQQTSSSNDITPQGNLAAYGVCGDTFHGFSKSFTEHGFIIGLVNVRADLTYQQGLNRMWSRQTRFDFFQPTLCHVGEQAVLNKEIYAQGNSTDDDVFGYQERYSEYKYFPSLITGKLRSTDPQSLDVWHLSQKFEQLPVLNSEFIQDKPPLERVLAVQDEPQFIMDVYFNMSCVRPMPVYNIPGLMTHF